MKLHPCNVAQIRPTPAPPAPALNTSSASTDQQSEEFAPQLSDAPALPAPAPAPTPTPSASDALIVLENSAPPYPTRELKLGIEGSVQFKVRVGIDGRALSIMLMQSSGNRALDRAALNHIKRKWRFMPRTVNGVPVESDGLGKVRFSLDK
ncbi:energy transducer TonB [bacterium]|nr:energy transducer TonB [bacterium]